MKQLSFLKWSLMCCTVAACSSVCGQVHLPAMHPKRQIDFVREQIRLKKEPLYSSFLLLLKQADSCLDIQQHAVVDFSIPGFYVNKEEHRRLSAGLQTDGFSAYCCALAWRLTGVKKYARKSVYFLNAWSDINKMYSQLDGSLVMSYSGTSLINAADLLTGYNDWRHPARDSFNIWVKNVFQKAANSIRFRNNNSGDWSRLASVLSDCYLNDTVDLTENIRLIKRDLFDKIAPDGHMVEEVKRQGNGIWYTYFSLAPLTASMWIIYNATGENLFFEQKDGASIKKALDYLLYYNQHPSEWKWFKNPATGKVSTPTGFWPANLLEAMNGIYHERKFDLYVAPYRPIEYPRHDFAWTFPTLLPLDLKDYE